MQGQSLSITALPEKTSYPLIDSVKAGAANATTKDAYVTDSLQMITINSPVMLWFSLLINVLTVMIAGVHCAGSCA